MNTDKVDTRPIVKDKAMFRLISFLAVTLTFITGCQAKQPMKSTLLTTNVDQTKQNVLQNIPVGSSIEDAQHLMEAEGCECSHQQDDKGTFLYCDIHKNDQTFVSRRWQVIIYYKDEKVTSVSTSTGLVGL